MFTDNVRMNENILEMANKYNVQKVFVYHRVYFHINQVNILWTK